MKLRSVLLGAACLFATAFSSFAAVRAASGDLEALWSVRLFPNQFQSGLAGELLKSLGVFSSPGIAFEGVNPSSIVSLEVTGFSGSAKYDSDQFLAEIALNIDKKAADKLFDALTRKYGGAAAEIAGQPAIRYTVPGGGNSSHKQEFWLARVGDSRFIVSPYKSILETALKHDPAAPSVLGPRRDNELLGGLVELDRLQKAVKGSELLGLVRHLDFHIDSNADTLHLEVDAAVRDKRSAKRVARMLEGMITAMSLDTPGPDGSSLDDRLNITPKDDSLEIEITLNAKESRELIDAFTKGIHVSKQAPAKEEEEE